ncbi:G-patch domain-containing protein [Tanacetum coccineum]
MKYVCSSARSLAGSSTPPNRAYLWIPRSGPTSAMAVNNDDSSEDEIPKTSPRPMPHSVCKSDTERNTSMPSPEDTIRLVKILEISNEEAGLKADISKKYSKGTSGVSPLDSRSAKNKSYRESHNKNRRDKGKSTMYATQPVSFISCGIMESEPGVTIVAVDESKPRDQTAGSSSYCAFKMHTTGFGSRMMAKMGYVDESDGRKLLVLKFVEPVTLLYKADPSASSKQPADQTSSDGMFVIFLMNVTILPAPSIVIRLTNVDCAFKEMECEIVKLEEDNRETVKLEEENQELCFERIKALGLENTENLRDSMLGPPDAELSHTVNIHLYPEEGREISEAYYLLQTFKQLFVDLILTFKDRDSSQSYFRHLKSRNAFYVAEIELGLSFDMLYTKANVDYSFNGILLRLISISVLMMVPVGFYFLCEIDDYHLIDIVITYLLVGTALIMDKNLTRKILILPFLKQPNKQRNFHRDIPETKVFAYGETKHTITVPGHTIEAMHGVSTYVTQKNRLPSRHILPVDDTIPTATPRKHKGIPTVVHLHGGIDEQQSDGNSHSWFTVG